MVCVCAPTMSMCVVCVCAPTVSMCVVCVCTYHEHVPVRFTDGYIKDTGVPRIVCREIKMANMGLGFRLEEGRVCVCF